MSATKTNPELKTTTGLNEDGAFRAAAGRMLQAVRQLEQARARLAELREVRRQSNDAIAQAEAFLQWADAERAVVRLEAEVEKARRAQVAAREQAMKPVRSRYELEYRKALAELDAVFDGVVIDANERVRDVWNSAYRDGIKLPTLFCPYFLPPDGHLNPWFTNWRRILRKDGWLPG